MASAKGLLGKEPEPAENRGVVFSYQGAQLAVGPRCSVQVALGAVGLPGEAGLRQLWEDERPGSNSAWQREHQSYGGSESSRIDNSQA